jgi:AraC-like DNA-binding protein
MNCGRKINTERSNRPAVSASYLKLFLQMAEEEGWEKSQLLKGVSLNISELSDTDYIGFSDVNQLIANCQHITQDPATGLKLGEKFQISSHGILGYAIMGAPTHVEGLQVFKRFIKLRTSIITFDMDINHEHIFLYFDCTQDVGNINRFMMEAALSGTCALTRYLNDTDPVVSVHFSFPKPEHTEQYDDFFSVPVNFNCNRDCIVLQLNAMTENTKSANTVMYDEARKQCSALIAQLEKNTSMKEKVKHLLFSQPVYFFDQKNMAEQLHMSPRSLRRQLKAESTSYQKVLDEVRCELARHYLQKHLWSIDEIAEMLGYSETANFSRAFRRWTGKTPAQIRG